MYGKDLKCNATHHNTLKIYYTETKMKLNLIMVNSNVCTV